MFNLSVRISVITSRNDDKLSLSSVEFGLEGDMDDYYYRDQDNKHKRFRRRTTQNDSSSSSDSEQTFIAKNKKGKPTIRHRGRR